MQTFAILLTLVLAASLPSAVRGQAYTFTNKSVEYVIEFPSSKWRALPAGIVPERTRKEFIYSNRNSVRLLVRRKLVDAGITLSDMVRRRQSRGQNLPGYVLLKEENFTGQLSGAKFSYEYTQRGKPMTAVIYYLEAAHRIIYSLRFTGTRDNMQSLHDQTESIARSFRLKNLRRV